MGLVSIDTKGAIDEAAKVLIPALGPILDKALDKLFENLKGRIITVTIVENQVQIAIK
jgi:hypothetical protein